MVSLFRFCFSSLATCVLCECLSVKDREGDKKEEEEMETVWVTKPHPWLPFPRYVRQLES